MLYNITGDYFLPPNKLWARIALVRIHHVPIQSSNKTKNNKFLVVVPEALNSSSHCVIKFEKQPLGKHRRHHVTIFCLFAALLSLFLHCVHQASLLVYFSVSRDESQPFGGRQLSLNSVFVLPKHITLCSRMRCVNSRRIYFLGSWGTLMCPVPLTSQFRLQTSVWIPIIPTERSRRDFKCLRMTVNNKERHLYAGYLLAMCRSPNPNEEENEF